LPSLSPAVAAAQQRLLELRRIHGTFPVSGDEQKKVRRTSESATHPERLTHSERWAEIARRGLFSQPLVEHLKRVLSDGRQVTSEEGASGGAAIEDPLPNPLPQGEGAGSPAPLLPRPPALLKVYPDIALAILRRKKAAPGRVWLLLRHADAAGRGAISEREAARLLTGDGAPLRVCGRRQLANLLAAGDGLFWERRAGVVWLRGAARVAAALGVARLGGAPVGVPLAALTGSIGRVRAHLYASFHSGRQRADLLTGRPQPRGPIARATLTALSAAAPNSQRAYERRAGVGRRSAVAVGPPVGAADEQEVAWRRGRALFHLRDARGRLGRPGAVYLAWQLPNEYTGPHATLPRGRQKRLNRALADLFHDGMTGNGETPGGSIQYSVFSGQYSVDSCQLSAVGGRPPAVGPRRFYGAAKAALLARHDGERYWRGPEGKWHYYEGLGVRD